MIIQFSEDLLGRRRRAMEIPFREGEIDYAIQSQLCD
jgi:hypothetical protein